MVNLKKSLRSFKAAMSVKARGNFGIPYELDSYDLLEFAKAYRDLGDAITKQLDDILDDPSADVNPNAVREIKRELGGANQDIDDSISDWELTNKVRE